MKFQTKVVIFRTFLVVLAIYLALQFDLSKIVRSNSKLEFNLTREHAATRNESKPENTFHTNTWLVNTHVLQ
jgi:hypothetical protein